MAYYGVSFEIAETVLNLIINGLPSKQNIEFRKDAISKMVLNLIINGLPSKLQYH